MNKPLADQAKKGLTDKSVKTAGRCQHWVRLQIIEAYGARLYRKYFQKYMKGSAYETMLAFQKSPYAVPVENGSVIGDILYKGRKTSGKYGHVGIRIAGNKVAENSSSHIAPGDNDARGIRSYEAFGPYELIVRLPEPSKLS
jgi:hypothetical protein